MIEPTIPGTACNEKQSQQSSILCFSINAFAINYEKNDAAKPIIKLTHGST